jgi:AcrR family transcriptional regulator
MSRPNERQHSPRIRRKRLQARQEILAAARRILRNQGIEGVTLAAVAGALGMTKQAIYHYFPSKDALILGLVTALLDDEIEALTAALELHDGPQGLLGTLVRAFYDHYISRLDAFRVVYCQTQLGPASAISLDRESIHEEINPRTRHLFDILESRVAKDGSGQAARQRARRLAFTAWTSVLGLLTMLSIADATGDPLAHRDADLVDTLVEVFDSAATVR